MFRLAFFSYGYFIVFNFSYLITAPEIYHRFTFSIIIFMLGNMEYFFNFVSTFW